MKRLLPAILLVLVAVGLSAVGGDTNGTSLLLYAGIVLLLVTGFLLRPKSNDQVRGHIAGYIVCIGIFFFIARTHFPFRVTFSLGQSALDEIASRVRAHDRVSLPARAGLFTIREAGQKEDGSIYLWTDPDPSGPEGFVFGYTGEGYNIWSDLKLKNGWWFICED
jgi:hypothetical protein